MNDPAVLEWLWSDEGLKWHADNTNKIAFQRGYFGQLKQDHECNDPCVWPDPKENPVDTLIRREMKRYGMNGVPPLREEEPDA